MKKTISTKHMKREIMTNVVGTVLTEQKENMKKGNNDKWSILGYS